MVQWQDKKANKSVCLVTTHGNAVEVELQERLTGAVKKPAPIHAYNFSMNGCDRAAWISVSPTMAATAEK